MRSWRWNTDNIVFSLLPREEYLVVTFTASFRNMGIDVAMIVADISALSQIKRVLNVSGKKDQSEVTFKFAPEGS